MMRNMTVEERYQPQIGGLKNIKKPFGIAKSNYSESESESSTKC